MDLREPLAPTPQVAKITFAGTDEVWGGAVPEALSYDSGGMDLRAGSLGGGSVSGSEQGSSSGGTPRISPYRNRLKESLKLPLGMLGPLTPRIGFEDFEAAAWRRRLEARVTVR